MTDVVGSQRPAVESGETSVAETETETDKPIHEEIDHLPIFSAPAPAPSDPAERVRAFAARQAEHVREVEEIEDAEAAEEKPPSKPFSQLLAAFMELRRRNWRLAKQSRGRRRAIKCLQANDHLYRTMHGPFIEEYRELRAENKRLTAKLEAMTEKR